MHSDGWLSEENKLGRDEELGDDEMGGGRRKSENRGNAEKKKEKWVCWLYPHLWWWCVSFGEHDWLEIEIQDGRAMEKIQIEPLLSSHGNKSK